MNKEFIISGFVFLVLAGLAGADFIFTSITTDGTYAPGELRTKR